MPLEVKVRTVKPAAGQQTQCPTPRIDGGTPAPEPTAHPQPIHRVNVYRRPNRMAVARPEARLAVPTSVVTNPSSGPDAKCSTPAAAATSPISEIGMYRWMFIAATWMIFVVLTVGVFSTR